MSPKSRAASVSKERKITSSGESLLEKKNQELLLEIVLEKTIAGIVAGNTSKQKGFFCGSFAE